MDFTFSEEEEALRDEVQAFIKDNFTEEVLADLGIEDPFELYRAQQEASRAVLPPAHNNRGLPSEPA